MTGGRLAPRIASTYVWYKVEEVISDPLRKVDCCARAGDVRRRGNGTFLLRKEEFGASPWLGLPATSHRKPARTRERDAPDAVNE